MAFGGHMVIKLNFFIQINDFRTYELKISPVVKIGTVREFNV
jgi:hypothetical protein